MTPLIVACRPTDLDLDDPLDRVAAESTFVYEGSVEGKCTACQRGIWIGPRGQVARDNGADPYCFACAVQTAYETGLPPVFKNLGNPEPIPDWVKKPDEH